MKKIHIISIVNLLLISFSNNLIADTKFVFATHTKPPLSNKIEAIYQEAFHRMGYDLDFFTWPGRRVLYSVNNGIIDGDASRMKPFKQISSDNTDNYLLVDEVVINIDLVVIVKNNINLEAVNWKVINEGKVAYIRGSMNIQDNVYKKNRVPLTEAYSVMEMVKQGRVDSAILFKAVATKILDSELVYSNYVKIIDTPIETFYLYPFLNKKHIDLQTQLKKALQEIKSDGTYDKIISQSY
jgi:polar amino acid transport system substrate-binding protein